MCALPKALVSFFVNLLLLYLLIFSAQVVNSRGLKYYLFIYLFIYLFTYLFNKLHVGPTQKKNYNVTEQDHTLSESKPCRVELNSTNMQNKTLNICRTFLQHSILHVTTALCVIVSYGSAKKVG